MSDALVPCQPDATPAIYDAATLAVHGKGTFVAEPPPGEPNGD